MSGDYSRKTFDPHRHFDAVRMQQGRVQLDADWNEESDIQDRRWRAETVDVIGRCGCPDETPDAFRIDNAGGALSIGIGRTYVHGLLAENFGEPPLEFDRILAEERGTLPVPYLTQPYLPNAAALLDDLAAGRVLVYLDVWQREVTSLEAPDLVEKAVGVDTTARRQTVWQVRLLDGVGDIDCSTPDDEVPGWLPIVTPSGGRLSSRGAGVADPGEPCLIPPSGGYRGLENRLYRVEIHDGGAPGPATFKWSRYNGTVATAVTAIPELDTLRVERTGRDDVLRFDAGDWVEVIDDHLELAGEPGIVRRIDSVDDGTRTIVLRDDLPAGVFPVDAQDRTTPGRHTRVRRWDQSGVVRDTNGNVLADLEDPTSPGVVEVPPDGTSLVLEDGVEITFDSDPAGGPVRTGDSWCFAARFADASVEELTVAPPEDVHHHHCRLAVTELAGGGQFVGTPTDCRTCFPPLTAIDQGCCTVVVEPGESIQEALDSLPPEGGCVCVKTGLHPIAEPIRIAGSNVVLHGESPGSRIRREDGVTVLIVADPTGAPLVDVEVRGLRLECSGRRGQGGVAVVSVDAARRGDVAIVFVDRCNELTIADCELAPDAVGAVVGVRLGSVLGGRIERCAVGPVVLGVWVDTGSTNLDVLDNTFTALEDREDRGIRGIWLEDAAIGASRIEGNRVEGFLSGISLNSNDVRDVPSSGAHGTRIVANTVVRRARQGSLDDFGHVFGIDVAANGCRVAENVLDYGAPFHGGIRLTGDEGCVEDNRLHSGFRSDEAGAPAPLGIQVGFLGEEAALPAARSVVRGNRLTGLQDAILAVEAEAPRIADNEIGGELPVRLGIRLANVRGAEVAGNRIRGAAAGIHFSDGEDNLASGNTVVDGAVGVLANAEAGLRLADNRIENLTGPGMLAFLLTGATAINGNRVASCGFDGFAVGVGVVLAFGELRLIANEVLNTGVSRDETQVLQPALGLVAVLVLESLIESNIVTQTNFGLAERELGTEDRALLAQGLLDFQLSDRFVLGFPVQILDNKFTGPGHSHLVELRETPVPDNRSLFLRFERVAFSDNHCWHWVQGRADKVATVALRGRRAIVMGNHVKAIDFRPAFDFNGITGTYVGNDTDGHHPINFSEFPAPLTNFNR